MDTKFLDKSGLTYLWTKMRLIFLRKEDFENKKTTTITDAATDEKIPTAKAVWTLADSKIAKDKVGEGLAIDEDGVLSALAEEVQTASKTVKGIVQIGEGLDIDANGVLKFAGDLSDYQTTDNLTQTLSAESTADTYPSAKATYDHIETLMEAIANGSY